MFYLGYSLILKGAVICKNSITFACRVFLVKPQNEVVAANPANFIIRIDAN
tara:strand:- start:197 stop:349 length:153 start_codon:yes stop_codon:yes gene_type:complete